MKKPNRAKKASAPPRRQRRKTSFGEKKFTSLNPYQKILALNNFFAKIPFGYVHSRYYANTELGRDMGIAIRKLEISPKMLSACQDRFGWYQENYVHKWRITEEQYIARMNNDPKIRYFADNILVPLYIELRRMGHSHIRLWR